MNVVKCIAFDLDGTLTQHKTLLSAANREVLDRLAKKYELLVVGAGSTARIFGQLASYPISVIGNYGMQFGEYSPASRALETVWDESVPCDRESVSERIEALRRTYGYTAYAGQSVEFHDSGCVTFPLLGTRAAAQDKLRFDHDRAIRRAIYPAVKELFPDYTVFVGGSSSFDFAPSPYQKAYALDRFCTYRQLRHGEVMYVGDDYGPGGNDESVYRSDFAFRTVDDYRNLYYTLFDLS